MRVLDGSMEAGQLTTGLELRASKVDFQRAGPSSPVSAISGRGTIAFPGLETDPIQIGPGDFLYVAMARSLNPLKPIEPFQIRSISVGKAIEVELRGAVGKLALGPGGALRSKMPTLLQYVYWNSWLQMLIGAALTIGAAVIC